MIFYYVNVETIGKCIKIYFFLIVRKITSSANEFLLHKCRNNRVMQKKLNLENSKNPANEFASHKFRNKKI